MRYLLTLNVDDDALQAFEGELLAELEQAHGSLQRALRASGELVDTNELSETDARVVRVQNGSPVVTIGPLTASGLRAGGFYLLECVDIDRAVAIAARFVESRYAPIEVRRVGTDGPDDR